MKMRIGRWGNSLAVRIPKELADRFDLKPGSILDGEALEREIRKERNVENDA